MVAAEVPSIRYTGLVDKTVEMLNQASEFKVVSNVALSHFPPPILSTVKTMHFVLS